MKEICIHVMELIDFIRLSIPFRLTRPKLSVFDQQLTISDAGSSKALEHGTPFYWPEECSISVTLRFVRCNLFLAEKGKGRINF